LPRAHWYPKAIIRSLELFMRNQIEFA